MKKYPEKKKKRINLSVTILTKERKQRKKKIKSNQFSCKAKKFFVICTKLNKSKNKNKKYKNSENFCMFEYAFM